MSSTPLPVASLPPTVAADLAHVQSYFYLSVAGIAVRAVVLNYFPSRSLIKATRCMHMTG